MRPSRLDRRTLLHGLAALAPIAAGLAPRARAGRGDGDAYALFGTASSGGRDADEGVYQGDRNRRRGSFAAKGPISPTRSSAKENHHPPMSCSSRTRRSSCLLAEHRLLAPVAPATLARVPRAGQRRGRALARRARPAERAGVESRFDRGRGSAALAARPRTPRVEGQGCDRAERFRFSSSGGRGDPRRGTGEGAGVAEGAQGQREDLRGRRRGGRRRQSRQRRDRRHQQLLLGPAARPSWARRERTARSPISPPAISAI